MSKQAAIKIALQREAAILLYRAVAREACGNKLAAESLRCQAAYMLRQAA